MVEVWVKRTKVRLLDLSKEASTDEYSLGSAEAKAEELDREPER